MRNPEGIDNFFDLGFVDGFSGPERCAATHKRPGDLIKSDLKREGRMVKPCCRDAE